eukprot:GILK01008503.1.p1 GENE.GILK01008503.1~~GILK01008503.1.p1  ORF type:complete len:338 (-),score=32.26 GILK01008503.1:371-1384(-)
MDGDDWHVTTVRVLLRVCSIASLLGSFFMILSYLLLKDMRTFNYKLLLYLSIADLGCACTLFMSSFNGQRSATSGHDYCVTQGFMLYFFYMASYLWTSCLAYHLRKSVSTRCERPERYEPLYHLAAWGVPIAASVVLLCTDHFGDANRVWCWITDQSFFPLLFFYIPVVFMFCYNLAIYVMLTRRVGRFMSFMNPRIRKRISLYLLVFLACTVWGLLNRLIGALVLQNQNIRFLDILDAFFCPLQGFLNALVYGMNRRLRTACMSLFPCCDCLQKSCVESEGNDLEGSAASPLTASLVADPYPAMREPHRHDEDAPTSNAAVWVRSSTHGQGQLASK